MNCIEDITHKYKEFKWKDQKPKIAIGFNIAVLAMVILAIVAMVCGTHPSQYPINDPTATHIYPGVFSKPYGYYFAYFALIINLIAAICSIVNIAYYCLWKQNKIKVIPKWLHITNFAITANLILNFFFTVVYLIPISVTTQQYYFAYLFTGSNLIFNGFVPLVFAIQFIFCFKNYKLKLVEILYSLIPIFIYCLVYGILALTNIKNGRIDPKFDIYLMGQKYFWLIFVAFVVIMGVTFSFGWLTNKANEVSNVNRLKIILTVDIILAIIIPIMTALMFYHNMAQDAPQEGLGMWETFGLRFLFFTHWSNWIVGVVCIIQAVYIAKIIKGKIHCMPSWVQVSKLASVAFITVTLLMQFIVAAGMMASYPWQQGIDLAYRKAFYRHLLFEHYIIPIVAIVSFILLEHSKIKFKHLFYTPIPPVLYTLIYVIVLYCHIGQPLQPEGKVTPWDVYNITKLFGKTGPYLYWAAPIVIYIFMFGLNWLYWLMNRKIHFDYSKADSIFNEFKEWKKNKANKKLLKAKEERLVRIEKPKKVVKKQEVVYETKPVSLHKAGIAILAGLVIFIGLMGTVLSLCIK